MDKEFYMDDGTKVDPDSIPIPSICLSCSKNQNNESACVITRMDQLNEIKEGQMFCCFAFEPFDPTINKKSIFKEMKKYLNGKNESL